MKPSLSPFRAYMAALREKSGKSVREIASDAGVAASSVWRCEKDGTASVYGGTLNSILVHGYGLANDSPAYRKATSLWATHKTGARTVLAREEEWSTLAKQINRMSKQQLAIIQQLIDRPSLLAHVGGMIGDVSRSKDSKSKSA